MIGLGEPLALPPFLSKSLDHSDPGNRIGEKTRHITPGNPGPGEPLPHPGSHRVHDPDHERKGNQRDQGELGADPDEHSRSQHDQEYVG